jgi:tellurite resistance protein TehA-like permease
MESMVVKDKIEGTAIASLVLAVLSTVLGPFGSLPAIVCGHIARARIRRDPSRSGDGLALAGLIVGYIFTVLTLVAAVWFLFLDPPRAVDFESSSSEVHSP